MKFDLFIQAVHFGALAHDAAGNVDPNHPDGPIGDPETLSVMTCSRAMFSVFAPTDAARSSYARRFGEVLLLAPTLNFCNQLAVMGDVTDDLFQRLAARMDLLLSVSASTAKHVTAKSFVDVVMSPKMQMARDFRVWFDSEDPKEDLRLQGEYAVELARVLTAPRGTCNERILVCAVSTIQRFLCDFSLPSPPYVHVDARTKCIAAGLLGALCNILSTAQHSTTLHTEVLVLLSPLLRKNVADIKTPEIVAPVIEQLTSFVLKHPSPVLRREGVWVVDALLDSRPPPFLHHPLIRGLVAFLVNYCVLHELGAIQHQFQVEAKGLPSEDEDAANEDVLYRPPRLHADALVGGIARAISRVFSAAARFSDKDLMNFLTRNGRQRGAA